MKRGSCLCGAVTFEVDADLRPAEACHCSRCRKLSGHHWSSTDVSRSDLSIGGEEHLRWYATSARVRRGFCTTCGSALFWDPLDRDIIAVAMGAFDLPTGTRIAKHIHVGSKGDHYEITDGLPEHPGPG